MTNKRFVSGYLVALLLVGINFSCSEDQLISPTPEADQIQTVSDGNYQSEVISLELAKQVAENEAFQRLYFTADSTKSSKGG